MDSKGGSKQEAVFYFFSAEQISSMAGVAVKCDISGGSTLVSRWKRSQSKIECELGPVDLCLWHSFLLTILLP